MRSKLPASVGDVIGGKYRVESILGFGGMGVVLGATHLALGQPVALKFLLPEAAADEMTRARFDREARALGQLESDHVARIMDVEALPDGTPFLVLEHLSGRDLADVMDVRGALPVEEAVELVLEACDAVAEAHALGIIHRDLKPENLFLCERSDGSRLVKVIDFGISKVSTDSAAYAKGRNSAVTRTMNVVGSPMYMSPEQLRSARDVDARSDVWSLGVTLYELLSAQVPFPWGTVPEVCAAVLKDVPVPLLERNPMIPVELAAAINCALSKDRDQRWPNVAAFAAAIAPFGGVRAPSLVERIVRVSKRSPRQQLSSDREILLPSDPTQGLDTSDFVRSPTAASPHSFRRSDSLASGGEPPPAELPARIPTRSGRRTRTVAGVAAACGVLLILIGSRSRVEAGPLAARFAPIALGAAHETAGGFVAVPSAEPPPAPAPPVEAVHTATSRSDDARRRPLRATAPTYSPAPIAPSPSEIHARAFEHRK